MRKMSRLFATFRPLTFLRTMLVINFIAFSYLVVFTTRSKKLLGAPGIATRNKDATRGSWPYY